MASIQNDDQKAKGRRWNRLGARKRLDDLDRLRNRGRQLIIFPRGQLLATYIHALECCVRVTALARAIAAEQLNLISVMDNDRNANYSRGL